MFFLLQEENGILSLDNQILKELLDKEKYIHIYKNFKNDDFFKVEKKIDVLGNNKEIKVLKNKELFPKEIQQAIPLGTIEFTENFFKIFYGIEKENPIEIPPILRTEEFLKRKYSIVTGENIPKSGQYFIKDVSNLKVFSYEGELSYLFYDGIFDTPKQFDTSLHLKRNNLYQVSELVNILSEYRIFVINNEIYSVSNYNGDVTIFPDMKLIKKAINLWSTQKDCPKSYSLDVAITPKGTIILECHILFSTGIYTTVHGTSFLWGYRDAKDYLINYNTKITEFSNF